MTNDKIMTNENKHFPILLKEMVHFPILLKEMVCWMSNDRY